MSFATAAACMKTGATKPEWDTPPNGDFASYVERLTAPPSARKAPPMATRATSPARQPAAGSSSTSASQALPPDLAQVLLPLLGVLRTVRAVLLLFLVMHGVALFVFSQGSLPGLIFMAALWWGLGWLIQAAPQAIGPKAAGLGARPEPLQERLRQVAQQRNSGKKRQ